MVVPGLALPTMARESYQACSVPLFCPAGEVQSLCPILAYEGRPRLVCHDAAGKANLLLLVLPYKTVDCVAQEVLETN